MNNLTDNKNLLQPGNFKVTIDSVEFANLQFFCTVLNLPSFSKNAVDQPYRGKVASFPGDTLMFDTLELAFIIDEDMRNYEEVYNWVVSGDVENPKFKDITLSILSNRNTTNRQIKFHDAFPINVGGVEFNTTDTDSTYLTCNCSFKYSYFEFIK